MKNQILFRLFGISVLASLAFSACNMPVNPPDLPQGAAPTAEIVGPASTPLPTRPPYQPGELVDYTVQTGDNLPALAAHFNTSEKEIRTANPIIPHDVTTLPPGMPMRIPIYYQSLWGNPYHILPDSLFVNGPAQIGFDPVEFVNNQPGWFKQYSEFAGTQDRKGGELIQYVADNFSVSPRILLMIVEYQTHALSDPNRPASADEYPLGYKEMNHKGLYRQLVWAANILNNGYYGWRNGSLTMFDHPDGRLERPDPWQNAATVAIDYYYSRMLPKAEYEKAVYNQGFVALYQSYFGDVWANVQPHIPGSLFQPALRFPFLPGKAWAFTGGPHTGWGDGAPWAALDFAPPSVKSGCVATEDWATAVADGYIVRSGQASAVLDLDGDHDEHTGWTIYYLHLANDSLIRQGTLVKTGDPLGHPSCEGGNATGTHVHIARKYNGEWISAGGALAFNLEGWIASNGEVEYQGKLSKYSREVVACVCSDAYTRISSGED